MEIILEKEYIKAMTNKLEILSKIDDEEVEILKGEHYIKYLYETSSDGDEGNIYIKAGLEVEPEDLLQSIYAIIYSAYQGLKSNPVDAAAAELLRQQITAHMNSDEFWTYDGAEMVSTSRDTALHNRKKLS